MSAAWTPDRLQAELDACPAIAFLGLKVIDLDEAALSVQLEMPLRPELERASGSGQFHGGPVAALLDTAGDYAVAMATGGGVPTMNLRVDYLRPSVGPRLLAVATCRRAGRSVAVVDIDLFDEEGRLCAIGRGTYSTKVG